MTPIKKPTTLAFSIATHIPSGNRSKNDENTPDEYRSGNTSYAN